VVRTIGMFVVIAAILVIKDIYPNAIDVAGKLTASALGLGAAGVGAFAAAITASLLGGRFDRFRLILGGFLVSGLGIVTLGGVQNLYAVLGLAFAGGFGTFLAKVAVDAQVQDALPDRMRGRAFALYDILYNLASVVAGVVMVLLSSAPLRPVLIGAGLATFAVTAILARAMRKAGLLLTPGAPAR
jgi:MFS family permease